jgi:hypothetical protein
LSVWARANPEAFDEGGTDGIYECLVESVDRADLEPCACCGETLVRFAKPCRRCLRNMDEDRERREVEHG